MFALLMAITLDAARLHLETVRLVCDVQLSKNDRNVTLVFKREEKIDFSYDRMEIRRQYIVVFIFFIADSTHVLYGLGEQGRWLCHRHSNSSRRFSQLI